MDKFLPSLPQTNPATGRGEIIVVDDNRTNLSVMGLRLTRMGYATTLVDGPITALDMIQAQRFDLMILNMTMPLMSGISVLGEIRAEPMTRYMPVLMITARSDPGAAIDALGAGADDHVVKPFDFDTLGARIERLLDRARTLEGLRRANAALDARIAHRAVELSEVRAELAEAEAAHRELQQQYQALSETTWHG
ncbi:response regulator [Sphingomonas paeninsulae]|uniref:Response regulator n=1 Tax=Sphingomonas paeninsulae TaxID=2319844 RepID=A0A494TLL9_SPHPE|nr:response regulator [Sphingomonas paeninsulae]AYJ87913.1 response regulator [Sphingomonas paeninsulae]